MSSFTIRLLIASLACLLGATHLPSQSAWMYDAVVHDSDSGRYYFFFGPNYVVKDPSKPIDGLIRNTQRDWGLPPSWGGGDVDAAVYVPHNDAYYFFKDGQYAKKPRGSGKKCQAPKDVTKTWGTPAHWNGRVDAVVYKNTKKTYYLFHGNEYVKKPRGKKAGAPRSIANWGLPTDQKILGAVYTGIGKVLGMSMPGMNKYYFFYGTGYIRKDEGKNAGTLGKYRGNFRWKARPKNAWVGVACEAGYALKYRVDYTKANGKKKSESGTRTLGLSRTIKLPRDVRSVRVRGWAYNPFGDNVRSFDERFSSPPNTYFVGTGTLMKVRHRTGKWKSPLDDIEQGLEDAWDTVSNWTESAIESLEEELLVGKAKQAIQANSDLIKKLVNAGNAAVTNPNTYRELATLSDSLGKAVSGKGSQAANSAKRTIRNILASSQFRDLRSKAKNIPFNTLSIGLNVGAGKFVGAGAAVGGSFSAKNGNVSLSVGGSASLSSDVGPSGGISFGIERPGGSMAYVAVALPGPKGSEIEVVVSVPQLRVEGFAVTISPPGKKTLKKAIPGSISTGYSYEIF